MTRWLLVLCVWSLAGAAADARADVVYTYTGQPASGGPFWCPAPPCALTGWLSLPTALPERLALSAITPSAFQFTAPGGALGLPRADSYFWLAEFKLGTDAAGLITDWAMQLDFAPDDANHWYSSPLGDTDTDHRGNGGWAGAPSLTPGPGAWVEVPEPGTGVLVGVGALVIGWRRVRRGGRT